jgi:hypothetical protein
MAGFAHSARARRRALGVAIVAVPLVVVVLVVLLIPNHTPTNAEPRGDEGPAQLASKTPPVRLETADRRAINVLLDRFMPAALTRHDPATAWALAGPELRSGSTLAGWRAGTSPVPYYPVSEKNFHHWQTIEVGRRSVVFNILVHAVPSAHLGAYVFSGEVVKRDDRWLVNRMYTIAIMNQVTRTTREVGPADFKAPPPTSQTPSEKAVIGHLGIVPVVLIVGLVLLIPLGLALVTLFRARRWKRRVRASGRTELPPLPSGYGSGYSEKKEFASER